MFSRKITLGLTIAAVVGLLPATRAWADAGYTEKVLYIFVGTDHKCPNGTNPRAGLALDAAGNLYRTTTIGGHSQIDCDGSDQCGTVFRRKFPGLRQMRYGVRAFTPCEPEKVTCPLLA